MVRCDISTSDTIVNWIVMINSWSWKTFFREREITVVEAQQKKKLPIAVFFRYNSSVATKLHISLHEKHCILKNRQELAVMEDFRWVALLQRPETSAAFYNSGIGVKFITRRLVNIVVGKKKFSISSRILVNNLGEIWSRFKYRKLFSQRSFKTIISTSSISFSLFMTHCTSVIMRFHGLMWLGRLLPVVTRVSWSNATPERASLSPCCFKSIRNKNRFDCLQVTETMIGADYWNSLGKVKGLSNITVLQLTLTTNIAHMTRVGSIWGCQERFHDGRKSDKWKSEIAILSLANPLKQHFPYCWLGKKMA